jgi:hypothetical protein
MLVRYRMNSTITIEQFKDDIHKIITGQITSVNDLSAGCDKPNSQVVGAYPTSTYTAVDAASYTYSKAHKEYAGVTHYFRLGFSSTVMNAFTLAAGYDSGTNTLLNSQALTDETVVHGIRSYIYDGVMTVRDFEAPNGTYWGMPPNNTRSAGLAVGDRLETQVVRSDVLGIIPGTRITQQLSGTAGSTGTYQLSKMQTIPLDYQWTTVFRETSTLSLAPNPYNAVNQPTGIDFVITNKLFFISSPSSGINIGMFDLGKSGVSREFTNSMLMCSIDLNNDLAKIPYHYRFPTLNYGTMSDIAVFGERSIRRFKANGSIAIIENPAFIRQDINGNAISVVYGLFLIPPRTIGNNIVYQDGANLRRLTVNDYALLTE